MYKKIILVLFAVIGVLAPCVVPVNICRACETERIAIVEQVDVGKNAIAEKEECGARLRIVIAESIKRCFIKHVEIVTAVYKRCDDYGERLKHEQRRTFCFYARQAGGLPSGTLSPI